MRSSVPIAKQGDRISGESALLLFFPARCLALKGRFVFLLILFETLPGTLTCASVLLAALIERRAVSVSRQRCAEAEPDQVLLSG